MTQDTRLILNFKSTVRPSFRVHVACQSLGLPEPDESRHCITAHLPAADEPWCIGLILGPSGSGKSSVATALAQGMGPWPAMFGPTDAWPADATILDGFPAGLTPEETFAALGAVGLSGVRDWLKPYRALSAGQQARADLARALCTPSPAVIVDEFTSRLDRPTAQLVAMAIARAVRSGKTQTRRLIAVGCHDDIAQWLAPDWRLQMPQGQLARGSLQRPRIQLELRSCSRRLWRLFEPHHYLTGSLIPSARCYVLCHESHPIGFCATCPTLGKSSSSRVIHRLVVLPAYQGLGVGRTLLNQVARLESSDCSVSITTSHPGLARALRTDPLWRCASPPGRSRPHSGLLRSFGRKLVPHARLTVTFRFIA